MEEERRTHAAEIKVHAYKADIGASCWHAARVSSQLHLPPTCPCFSNYVHLCSVCVQRLEAAVEAARQGQRQAAEQADAVAKLAKVLIQEQV